MHTLNRTYIFTVLRINPVVWAGLFSVGALVSYSDLLRQGIEPSFWSLMWSWWRGGLATILLSCALPLVFARWPAIVHDARATALGYGAVLLFGLPLDLLYVAVLNLLIAGVPLTPAECWHELARIYKIHWFVDFALMSATYAITVGLCIWRDRNARERAWQHAQNDNLRLQLELEQQRLLSLRGQLEPHFIFNALNAISALVRSDDKSVALSGISRLSDLLRYALAASARNWVSFGEELQFIQDYLALQRLRYGDRLQIAIEGAEPALLAGDCPPLLLQPLVENALRHDLDRHDKTSDIRLVFALQGDELRIRICNPALTGASANPGLGLGLPHTRARLQLAWSTAASMHTAHKDGRFEVELRMPLHAPHAV